jgi:hypothetical protein
MANNKSRVWLKYTSFVMTILLSMAGLAMVVSVFPINYSNETSRRITETIIVMLGFAVGMTIWRFLWTKLASGE